MIAWAFPAFSILGLLFSYSIKVILSGASLGYTKFYIGFAINLFFMVTLLDAVEFDNYLYFGHCPEVIDTYPSIGWFALVCLLLHTQALPVKHDLNWWWKR